MLESIPGYVPPWCRHVENGVMPDHKCDAKYVIIGEAPGRREEEQGKPFVGPSGWLLENWWKEVGLTRADFFIMNVYPFRPKNNDLSTVSKLELATWVDQLKLTLRDKLEAPNVLCPTGNYALQSLLSADHKISDWRGSICIYKGDNGRWVKCIPTFHPAATMRQPVLTRFCKADWARIASEGKSEEIKLPVYVNYICHDLAAIPALLQQCDHEHYMEVTPPSALAIDIENNERRQITCVGFSLDGVTSFTIPTDPSVVVDAEQLANNWEAIRKLCSHPIAKVGQHFLTDQYKLWFSPQQIEVANFKYDLMEMYHCLDPNDGGDAEADEEGFEGSGGFKIEIKSLAVLTSLYTRQPYYKHLGSSGDWETRMRYNGMDCCMTREIYPKLYLELAKRGLI